MSFVTHIQRLHGMSLVTHVQCLHGRYLVPPPKMLHGRPLVTHVKCLHGKWPVTPYTYMHLQHQAKHSQTQKHNYTCTSTHTCIRLYSGGASSQGNLHSESKKKRMLKYKHFVIGLRKMLNLNRYSVIGILTHSPDFRYKRQAAMWVVFRYGGKHKSYSTVLTSRTRT